MLVLVGIVLGCPAAWTANCTSVTQSVITMTLLTWLTSLVVFVYTRWLEAMVSRTSDVVTLKGTLCWTPSWARGSGWTRV